MSGPRQIAWNCYTKVLSLMALFAVCSHLACADTQKGMTWLLMTMKYSHLAKLKGICQMEDQWASLSNRSVELDDH